jgi:hypothetical protein
MSKGFFDTPEETGYGGIHEGCNVRNKLLKGENVKLKRRCNMLILALTQVVLIAAITIGAIYSRTCQAAYLETVSDIPAHLQAHPARPGWSKVPDRIGPPVEPTQEPSPVAPVVSNDIPPDNNTFLGISYKVWWASTLLVTVIFVWFKSDSRP